MAKRKATGYRAVRGLNYTGPDGQDRRVEPGQIAEDFPGDVAREIEAGTIEPADLSGAPAADEEV